jgi:hypothetical protein
MDKTKFTARVDRLAFEAAKQYAGQHGTSISSLVEEFFRSLERVGQIPQETPVLKELTGSLRADTSLDDYPAYLEGKYLGDTGKKH